MTTAVGGLVVRPLLAVAVAAGPTAGTVAGPHAGPARPDGPAATGSYQCVLGGNDTEAVAATLQLDSVPESVRPGQVLRLAGVLTLSFPQQEALRSMGRLATRVALDDAEFALRAQSGRAHGRVRAAAVKGDDPTNVAFSAFDVAARVRFAPYRVPAGVQDELDLSLPAGTGDTPAFTVTLERSGLLTQQVATTCSQDADAATSPIVRLPVVRRTAAHPHQGAAPAHGGPSSTTGTPAAPPATDVLPPAAPPAGDADASTPGHPARPPVTDAPPSAGAERPRTESLTPAYAAIPPNTRRPGVFLPSWLLALGGLVIPLAAVAYAITTQRRLRLVRARIAARGRSNA